MCTPLTGTMKSLSLTFASDPPREMDLVSFCSWLAFSFIVHYNPFSYVLIPPEESRTRYTILSLPASQWSETLASARGRSEDQERHVALQSFLCKERGRAVVNCWTSLKGAQTKPQEWLRQLNSLRLFFPWVFAVKWYSLRAAVQCSSQQWLCSSHSASACALVLL